MYPGDVPSPRWSIWPTAGRHVKLCTTVLWRASISKPAMRKLTLDIRIFIMCLYIMHDCLHESGIWRSEIRYTYLALKPKKKSQGNDREVSNLSSSLQHHDLSQADVMRLRLMTNKDALVLVESKRRALAQSRHDLVWNAIEQAHADFVGNETGIQIYVCSADFRIIFLRLLWVLFFALVSVSCVRCKSTTPYMLFSTQKFFLHRCIGQDTSNG